MGVCALILLPFSESGMSISALIINAVKYSPASLCYIISMIIGYAGLRYLELSIVSPVQNASGALSAICMILYFTIAGKSSNILNEFSPLDLAGTALIIIYYQIPIRIQAIAFCININISTVKYKVRDITA